MGFLATVVEVITAVLIPPLAVFLVSGIGTAFFINILLTILGWIPGSIHALWITFASKGL